MANTLPISKKQTIDYSKSIAFLERKTHPVETVTVPWRVSGKNESLKVKFLNRFSWEMCTMYENVIRSCAVVSDEQGVFSIDSSTLCAAASLFFIVNFTDLPVPKDEDGNDDAVLTAMLTQYLCENSPEISSLFSIIYNRGVKAAEAYADTLNTLSAHTIGAAMDVSKTIENEKVLNMVASHLKSTEGDKSGKDIQ